MSCHLLSNIHLNDITGLREFLFPNLREPLDVKNEEKEKIKDKESAGTEGWEEEWGDWDEEKEEETGDTTPEDQEGEATSSSKKWLQDCIISVSPAADLIALAKEDRLVIMAPKFDGDGCQEDDMTSYSPVWSGSVAQEVGEFVSALLCLPLASQKRSTQGAPDWTCLLVGFSTGYVRMYTETGALLLSQKLHTEAVQRLKCITYTPRRYLGVAEQHEELLILFLRALVTIDGFSLYQALKACRNQVARATASGEQTLQPPPLAYKKWAPQDIETIVDCHTTGVNTPNPFDQMVLASLSSHASTIRPTPPAASVYLISGIGPYLGFYYAIEGSTQPILSEVAFAVASKLKSALMSAASGWLSFGSRSKPDSTTEKPAKIEPAAPLPLRFGLHDKRREGLCVCLSPNNAFVATTDSFGRVMLIDVDRGIALRMWKGYRDAQVGWVEVKEDESSSHNRQCRTAQFLVIYAARRGILEILVACNGPRVAAFNVSRHCQLISITHGILGLNNVTSRGVRIKAFQVGLLGPDGTLKTVQVPFHLALSDKNNKRVRDMHLLKKLKQLLKEHTEESGSLDAQVRDLLLNIKIPSIAQQGIDRVLSTTYLSPKFMEGILKACVQRLLVAGEEHMDIERRLFMQYCHLQEHLIQCYVEIQRLQSDTPVIQLDPEAVSLLLGLSESEVEHIIGEVERSQQIHQSDHPPSRVRFESDTMTNVSSFLGCFTCTAHSGEGDGNQQGGGAISLVKDLTEDRRLQLGGFLYESCFKHQGSPGDVGAVLKNTGIPMEQLASLLMYTWLSDRNRLVDNIPGLFNLLKILTASADQSKVTVDKTMESPWWQSLRDHCSHTTNSQSAFLAAVVARTVTMEISGVLPKRRGTFDAMAKDPDADTISVASETLSPTAEGETVSVDVELWNTVVQQLEDLMCVDCLLKLKPAKLRRVPSGSEELTVSVSVLLEGGKGCVTEVIARHIARVGFRPEDLYRPQLEDSSMSVDSSDRPDPETSASSSSTSDTNQEVVWDQMAMLRRRFPHSLENDVLFSNCCWEYAVIWNKLPEEVENLKSALDYVRLVQNAMLRQGVCSMMWHMFLSKKFQATAQLIERVGKCPKDRLCRKSRILSQMKMDIGIGETRLPQFATCVCDFLSIIMEANCETNEVPVFNIEPLWNQVKGTVSLVELAIDQKATNYGLLKLHHQLAVLILAVMTFNMKPAKVISLFDSKGNHAFFQDLYAHPLLPTEKVDTSIASQRREFLSRIISQSVHKLHECYPAPTKEEVGSPPSWTSKLRNTEVGRWPDQVLRLAEEWGIDLDYVKRHHVCMLYSAGFDKLAEEVLLTVNDRDTLGQQLLAIVGQRVAYQLKKMDAHMSVELMSNVNPALSTWLKSMNSSLLVQPDVPVTDIQSLLTQTINQLSESHPQHELAVSLRELVQVL